LFNDGVGDESESACPKPPTWSTPAEKDGLNGVGGGEGRTQLGLEPSKSYSHRTPHSYKKRKSALQLQELSPAAKRRGERYHGTFFNWGDAA